jgi:hypothetical protein
MGGRRWMGEWWGLGRYKVLRGLLSETIWTNAMHWMVEKQEGKRDRDPAMLSGTGRYILRLH